jgi:nucleotidyltransferase/DNA polymerase involved in DNA repair
MFATIYLPNFYLQATLRHQAPLPTTPVGLIDEQDKKATIIQLNPAAEAAGIRKGMTPSQGLARSLSLVIKTRSHAQEKLIGQIVLHYSFTLSPYVEATGPGVCTVQFTKWHRHPLARRSGAKAAADDSCAGLRLRRAYGSERSACQKLSRVINQLAECEITAQAGIAQNPDTSFLAAHLARPVLQIEDAKRFLAPLPIDTLAIALES